MAVLRMLMFSGLLLSVGIIASFSILQEQSGDNPVTYVKKLISPTDSVEKTFYKWQDENKVWHYSERPNVLARNEVVKVDLRANILPSLSQEENVLPKDKDTLSLSSLWHKKSGFLQQILGGEKKVVDIPTEPQVNSEQQQESQ